MLWCAGVCSLVLFWRLLVRCSVGLVGCIHFLFCLARVAWARLGLVVGAVFGGVSGVCGARSWVVSVQSGWFCWRSVVFKFVRARLPRGC